MKALLIISIIFSLTFPVIAQSTNSVYDAALAKSLGADEYGMKQYILVMLKTGSNTIEDKATLDSLFSGHLENIGRLAEAGKLIVAGPLGKNEKSYRGIFILDVATMEEAHALLATDPAINEKLLATELYPWYGSAALPVYLETHKKIEKVSPE